MRTVCDVFVVTEIVFLVCYLFALIRRNEKWKFRFSLGIVICSIVLIGLAIYLEHTGLWIFQLMMLLKYIGNAFDNYQIA